MKIEVCEQMLAAWLNHIKGCQLVQTNWIPSPVAVENLSEETLTSIGEFVSAINRFSEENNLDIFKHSTVKQMVGQCEIDIVGVRLEDGIVQKVYLIDSAFHENGLNYGDVVARVLKKILRAIFVADASFRNIPAQIVFVSPKCGENLRQILQEHVQFLRETVNAVSIPVFAIGGISAENVKAVRKAGAAGACIMSQMMRGEFYEK